MKYILPIFILLIGIFIYSCANQIAPTGGPKDTIPPTLIESIPIHKSINYHGQTFKLKFDEKINTDKIKQHLIITPFTENKYEVKSKKNEVTIIFEEAFDSLTTYTLNFGDGITDLNEKTPAVNLSLAFSTGPIIDSIFVKGNATDLYKNEPLEKITIALFDLTDTLNILTGKPKYFTKTNAEGLFLIENIKNGLYKIYAFDDQNNNMMNDPEEEIHGFHSQPLDLNTSKENINLRLLLLDTRPLQFNRGKYTGLYYDLTYNKFVKDYSVTTLYNPKNLPLPSNNLITENTSIRFYHDSLFRYEKDSIGLIVTAQDSLLNHSIDTVFVKFRESKRKPDGFTSTLTPKNKSKINPTLKHQLTFNKPIKTFSLDSIRYQYDTLLYHIIPDTAIIWDTNKTQLTIQSELDPLVFKNHLDSLKQLHADTTVKDSTELRIRSYLKRLDTLRIDFIIPKSAFISVENDTTASFNNSYYFKKPNDFGSVSGQVNTSYTGFIIQLVKTNYEVVQQIKDEKNYTFKQVPPGKYTIRVLIDSNHDGRWDYGNLQQDREPELIYFYPEIFDVRANWQLDNIQIDF